MIKYRGYPILKPIPESNRYELQESLHVVYTTDEGDIKAALVPKGYITDGASIPKALWSFVGSPYSPRFMTAAIVHDWHCDIRAGKIKMPKSYNPSVDEMSDLFFELLSADGVSLGKALSMEAAVRIYKSLF